MASGQGDTYWVLEERQLRVMTSPRRHDIVDRLAAGGPMSIKELAEHIGAQPSGLYHHISKLIAVGLVVEAGSRVVRRRREQLYATPAPRMRLAGAVAENKYPDLLSDIVSGLTRQMARDYRSAATLPSKLSGGEVRNLGFFRLVGRPSRAQLMRINACLEEVAEILWNSTDSDRPIVALGWVMAPLDDE